MKATAVLVSLSVLVFSAATAGSAGLAPAASAEPKHAFKICGGGFLHVIVRGTHVCRPAADLRVAVVGSPDANRVGGTVTYVVTVRNAGRRPATRVVLTAAAPAEYVSASSTVGSCSSPTESLRVACMLGNLSPKTRATATIAVRPTALGSLRLSVRASSPSRDARPRDNSMLETTRVTEPDSVRGSGLRPLSGPGQQLPVAVEVEAISGPRGEDPVGTFSTTNPVTAPAAGELRGRVVCLSVQGNRATVAGIVEQSTNPQYPPGGGVLFGFTDNGEPGAGRDTQLSYFNQDTASCPIGHHGFAELTLIDGNYVVRDVLP